MADGNIVNCYGDMANALTNGFGVEVSSQRMDELDKEALLFAINSSKDGSALDIGCGVGIQGLRFSSVWLDTLCVDVLPVSSTVAGIAGVKEFFPISYLQKEADLLEAEDLPDRILLCYSQRFIHYLTYEQALRLLRIVRTKMNHESRLFLSASGLYSELGQNYKHRNMPIQQRHTCLHRTLANKHHIYQSVCLYTEDELVNLCTDASFSAVSIYSSTFGNVKGVFVPC